MARTFPILFLLILTSLWTSGCKSNGRISNPLQLSGLDTKLVTSASAAALRPIGSYRRQAEHPEVYVIESVDGDRPSRTVGLPAGNEAGDETDPTPESLVVFPVAHEPNVGQVALNEWVAMDSLTDAAEVIEFEPGLIPMREVHKLQTLEDFEQRALSTNPVVLQWEAKLQALQGKRSQAGLKPNPVVGVSGQDINESGGAGMYGVYFGRELVRGNKLQISRSVVSAEMNVARQQLSEMRQRLTTDIRVAFYDLLVAQEKRDLANRLAEIALVASNTSEKLFQAKEVARSSVFQAQMEFQNATVIQGQAVNEEAGARRKLAALLGEADLPEPRIKGDLQQVAELANFEETYDQLLLESPELARLFENIQRARLQLQRECVEPISNVTWQATVQYDTVGESLVSGFQVGFPIPKFNRNQGAIRQAEKEIAVAEFLVEKKALELRQRLATAFERYSQAKLQVDIYGSKILPKAKSTFELISDGYRQGEVDFLSFLTAQRTFFDANLAYVSGLKMLWREHNLIQGMLLSASLTQDN